MTKSRDLKAELRSLQHGLCQVFQRTFPSKQFQAELMLGVISLELTLQELSRTRDLEERRRLKNEFDQGISAIRQGLKILWQSRWAYQESESETAALAAGLDEKMAASPSA